MTKYAPPLRLSNLPLKGVGLAALFTLAGIAAVMPAAQAQLEPGIELDPAEFSPPPQSVEGSNPIEPVALPGSVAFTRLPNGQLQLDQVNVVSRPQFLSTNAQGNLQGPLFDIVRAAADCWERALNGQISLKLNIGIADLALFPHEYYHPPTSTVVDGVLALHTFNQGQPFTLPDGRQTFREIEGTILFNSNYFTDASGGFFLDATPHQSEEFGSYTATSQDLGGGLINVGRTAEALAGAADGKYDLFTVALHEIGHALGFSTKNQAFLDLPASPRVTIPLPFGGTILPIGEDAHLNNFTGAVLASTLNVGERKQLSGLDVLASAEIEKFGINIAFTDSSANTCTSCTQPSEGVPEPSTIVGTLLGTGVLGTRFLLKRRKQLNLT